MDVPLLVKLRPRNEGEPLKKEEIILKRRQNRSSQESKSLKFQKLRRLQQNRADYGGKPTQSAMKLITLSRRHVLDKRRIKRLECRRKTASLKKRLPTTRNSIVLAVRNGRSGGSKRTSDTLQLLGLGGFHSCVILLNTETTLNLLKLVEPFVFFGYPNEELIKDLLTKRAMLKSESQRGGIPLSDNRLVEEHFHDLNMICVEDLIEAICTGVDELAHIMEQFEPFKVDTVSMEKLCEENSKFVSGNHRESINKLIVV